MSERSNNNVYRPKFTGFLVAAIALVLLVVALLASTVMILTINSQKDEQTTGPISTAAPTDSSNTTSGTTLPTEETDDPSQTSAPPSVTDDPVVPTIPSRVPPKVSPDESTITLTADAVNAGSLILLDDDHPYQVDPALMITRTAMGKLSEDELLETYGFERIPNTNSNYMLSSYNCFINSNALYYFKEMMADYVKESGNTDVQLCNGYYCTGDANDIESVEHSTGYYIDLQVHRPEGTYPLNYESMKAAYYDWFIENCWKYGFLHIRDKNNYSSFRFVGAAHAAAMHNSGTNINQYLDAISVYSYENRFRVTDGFGWEWWIYYVRSAGDATEIQILGNDQSCFISGDNLSGYVVAINSSCFA